MAIDFMARSATPWMSSRPGTCSVSLHPGPVGFTDNAGLNYLWPSHPVQYHGQNHCHSAVITALALIFGVAGLAKA